MCISFLGSIIKTVFVIINVAVFLAGLLVAGLAAYLAFGPHREYLDFIPVPEGYNIIHHVPYVALAFGILVAIIAFLGCCGAKNSVKWMLLTFAGVLTVLFLVQGGVMIYGLVAIKDEEDLRGKIHEGLTELFDECSVNEKSMQTVDLLQISLKCCGTDSAEYYKRKNESLPVSCYGEHNKAVYDEGCTMALCQFIRKHVKIVAVIVLVACFVEAVSAIFALYLVYSSK